MRRAICPGSFDPITNGHLDIIERSAALFDEVIVVVMTNYNKIGAYNFSEEERAALIRKSTAHLSNVKVDIYGGLLAQYCGEHEIKTIVKGLRAVSDFEDEFQQSIANRHIDPTLETVFLPCREEHMFLSSSVVRQIGIMGGDVSSFVPATVSDDIINGLRKD